MRINRFVSWTEAPPLLELSLRAQELAAAGARLLRLDQGAVDLPPPAEFTEAVARIVQRPECHRYTPDPGLPELRSALARYVTGRLGIQGCDAGQVIVTAGANQACFAALLALLEPGDQVLVPAPWYFNHAMTVTSLGGAPVPVGCDPAAGFVPRLQELERAITEHTRGLLLVNPNNPTGACYGPELVRRVTELCIDRGLWLLADQTYHELHFADEPPLSPGAVPGAMDHVVTCGSFSKSLGLAGWRLGFLIAPQQLVDQVLKVQDCSVICACHASQRGLLAALPGIERHVAHVKASLRERRDRLVNTLREHGLDRFMVPGGSIYLFLRLPDGVDDRALCRELLEHKQLVLVPGSAFGPGGAGHLRISFGSASSDGLAEAAGTLARFLAERTEA